MPIVLLERLPLPSLRTYTTISVVLLACAVYYALQLSSERQYEIEASRTRRNRSANITNGTSSNSSEVFDPGQGYLNGAVLVLMEEAWCVWTLINMAYCCLVLVGKLIQRAVFGELRVSEQQHVKDKFWNFVFYKFIFIFGVMNVQHMDEVMVWSAWFSMLGFLHLLSQLCKDRFEYLSFSPTTPSLTHAKVLLLLFVILVMIGSLFIVCFLVGFVAGINTFAFMIAECLLLGIKTLYVMVRYAIHLWDLHHEGVWENRALYVYWSEFTCEVGSLAIDFTHHLHMLVWGNIFISMASLVICMQLRYLFHELQRRLRRHKNYLQVVNSMQARFPMATPEDLQENNDDCAICWDKMESARKLPCGHLFHNSCLRSWLEQDTSCPTCRTSLSDPQEPFHAQTTNLPRAPNAPVPPAEQERQVPSTTNHFFHFDGPRYVSWLPSFSVEVTHTPLLVNGPPPTQIQTSQLDNMARDVQSVFPSMPLNVIMDDLRVTRSVELTIENILEGVLIAPPDHVPSPLWAWSYMPSESHLRKFPDCTHSEKIMTFGGRTLQNAPSSLVSNTAGDLQQPVHQPFQPMGGGDGPPDEPAVLPSGEQSVPEAQGGTALVASGGTEASVAAAETPQPPGGGDGLYNIMAMSSNNNINFMTDENIPDLMAPETEDSDGEGFPGVSRFPAVSGFRFSKSSTEREQMLQLRKHDLLELARKRYLSSHDMADQQSDSSDSDSRDGAEPSMLRYALNYQENQSDLDSLASSQSSHDDRTRRRELAFRAAQRRLQQRHT